MRTCAACAIGITLLFAKSHARAQAAPLDDRAELAERLRAFEGVWEAADEAGRKRALAILPGASKQFLGLNLKESARTLDLARYALQHDGEPSEEWKWANSMAIIAGPRLVDADSKGAISASFRPFYTVRKPPGSKARGFLAGPLPPPRPVDGRLTIVPECPLPGELRAENDSAEARYNAFVTLSGPNAPAPGTYRPVTRLAVPALAARLASFRNPPKTLPALETASLADYTALLDQFANGESTESHWLTPRRALDAAEAVRRDPAGGFFRATPGVACEFWLTVPAGGGNTPCRVQVPAVPAGQSVPVVVALHGVGGSEHMVPEAYGAGCLAKAASQANFALVCPRGGVFGPPPVPEILAELSKRFPLDTRRVHLVGHSLGASQAAELAQRSGANYESVTLLAGGGRVRDAAKLKATRLFLAVGDADFVAGSTRQFRDALNKAGVETHYQEYPGVEHLTVVRHAAPDVAKFWAAK